MKTSIGLYAYAKATIHLEDGDFSYPLTESFELFPVSSEIANKILAENDSDKQAAIYRSAIKNSLHRKLFKQFLYDHRGWAFFWYLDYE